MYTCVSKSIQHSIISYSVLGIMTVLHKKSFQNYNLHDVLTQFLNKYCWHQWHKNTQL